MPEISRDDLENSFVFDNKEATGRILTNDEICDEILAREQGDEVTDVDDSDEEPNPEPVPTLRLFCNQLPSADALFKNL